MKLVLSSEKSWNKACRVKQTTSFGLIIKLFWNLVEKRALVLFCWFHYLEWRSKSLVFAKLVKNKRTIVACTSRIRRKPVFSEISLAIRPDPVGAAFIEQAATMRAFIVRGVVFGAVKMSWVSHSTWTHRDTCCLARSALYPPYPVSASPFIFLP